MKIQAKFDLRILRILSSLSAIGVFTFLTACAVGEPKTSANTDVFVSLSNSTTASAGTGGQGATIPIEQNGPADTVRVFYKHLREKRFKEAIFLTNLRPAIEGLTDAELKDFSLDFETLAGQVPTEIEINGEIIAGDKATVTANLPGEDGDQKEIQTINLRRAGDFWVILTVDEEAENRIKKEGKSYFYNLRIETHQDEAKRMLERISKAQLAHSLQNAGVFTDMQTLVSSGLLPDDIRSSDSTGYNYVINLAADKKRYSATATPAVYGKSGSLSYILQLDQKGISRVSSRDNGGKVVTK